MDHEIAERVLAEDAYFVDGALAHRVARQRNRIAGGERVQICYYQGDPIADPPPNLIHAPIRNFAEFFSHNTLPLPTALQPLDGQMPPAEAAEFRAAFEQAIARLRELRALNPREPVDSYFFDREQAWQTALQQNRVDLGHPTIDGLQLCYHTGDPFADGPRNLIPVPIERFVEFFTSTPLRRPQALVLPGLLAPEQTQELRREFDGLLGAVQHNRNELAARMARACRERPPEPPGDGPLRVFFPSNRLTQVMQYASKNLAAAFERLGCETRVSIETSDLEQLDARLRLQHYLELRPHLVVNVNNLNTEWIHPAVHSVSWWQDPMPALKAGNRLAQRERDQIYSFSPTLDGYLQECGLAGIERQPFCIDTEVFRPCPEIERAARVVFVGSAGHRGLGGDPAREALHRTLVARIEAGEPLSRAEVEAAADDHGVDHDSAFWRVLYAAVRDTVVRWLCAAAPAAGLEVAVYGRYWDADPLVAPCFKGELPHGEAVARVYGGARYALVCHPFDVSSQRLAEAAACGAWPLIYDVRRFAEPPFWERHALFFNTAAGLAERLHEKPEADPAELAEQFSYERFARRIIERVQRIEARTHRGPAVRAG